MFSRVVAALAILLSSFAGVVGPASSAAAAQCYLSPGAVVQLAGTPHLFIVDGQGVLHWGGDTRALAGHPIDWSNECSVGLNELQAMPRGDPWLSSGLPKIGNPIYLSKWEDTDPAPTLLHIQSISDVELFGINESNYGRFVLDAPVWEQRYGFDLGSLQIGPLASAASFAWPADVRAGYSQLLANMENVLSAALFRATQGGADATALMPGLADCERAGLSDFERGHNPGGALGVAQDCLARMGQGGGGPIAYPPPPPPPPQQPALPPANVQVIAISPTVVRVLWADLPGEAGYRIYGGDQGTPGGTFVTGVPANLTSDDISGRLPSTTYCFGVSAIYPIGESPISGPLCVTTPSLATVPTAPTNISVTTNGTGYAGLRVEWTDTSTDESGFRIRRGDQVIATVGRDVAAYADTSWTPGTASCYRVVAYNDAGTSPSDQACLASVTPPTAPRGLRLSLAMIGTGAVLQVNWTDASSDETGFQIWHGDQMVGTVGANITTYSDPTASTTTPGCYRVVAYNQNGGTSSDQVCSLGGDAFSR